MTSRIRTIAQLPWKPSGRILDPYAGHRTWWRGLDTSLVTFTDKYFHDNGNLAADATMLPFPAGSFDQVWCDPPHLIRKSKFVATSRFYRRSNLTTATHDHGYFGTYPDRPSLLREWEAAALEFRRVLRPDGRLIWKSIDKAKTVSQCVNYDDLLATVGVIFTLLDERRFPSVMTWSTAETVYTVWGR